MSLQFQYEIPVEEYVDAQLLYYKLNRRRCYIERAAGWGLAGVFCVVTAVYSAPAFREGAFSLPLLLLAGIGIWWMLAALRILFPARRFRRAYSSSDFGKRSYKAEIDEIGLAVARELCEWRIQWPAVQFKAEGERVFIFHAANAILIFGKKFLSGEQQEELRRLSGLKP